MLDEEMNDLLFGGQNSVGKTVRIEDREFKVVGVLDTWRPTIKFYDLTQNPTQPPERLFMPFNFLRPDADPHRRQQRRLEEPAAARASRASWSPRPCWIQMWVELPDATACERLPGLPRRLRARAEEGRAASRARSTTGDAAHGAG